MIENKFSVVDRPDPRDKIAPEPILGATPKFISLFDVAKAYGMKLKKQERNRCTDFARIRMAEIENTIGNGKLVELSTDIQWAYQLATGASNEGGDSLQNAMNQFHKHPQGYPENEYRRLKNISISLLKRWLSLQRPNMTGLYWSVDPITRESNYKHLQKTGYYVPNSGKRSGAHAVVMEGFDDADESFLFIESELDTFGQNEKGRFRMKYEYLTSLMSQYISYDSLF